MYVCFYFAVWRSLRPFCLWAFFTGLLFNPLNFVPSLLNWNPPTPCCAFVTIKREMPKCPLSFLPFSISVLSQQNGHLAQDAFIGQVSGPPLLTPSPHPSIFFLLLFVSFLVQCDVVMKRCFHTDTWRSICTHMLLLSSFYLCPSIFSPTSLSVSLPSSLLSGVWIIVCLLSVHLRPLYPNYSRKSHKTHKKYREIFKYM